LQALVDILRCTFVTTVSNDGELGLHHARIDLGHPYLGVNELAEEGTGERTNSVLGCGVDAASSIGLTTSDRAQVDDMPFVLGLELCDDW
jgi:hypothetical protein